MRKLPTTTTAIASASVPPTTASVLPATKSVPRASHRPGPGATSRPSAVPTAIPSIQQISSLSRCPCLRASASQNPRAKVFTLFLKEFSSSRACCINFFSRFSRPYPVVVPEPRPYNVDAPYPVYQRIAQPYNVPQPFRGKSRNGHTFFLSINFFNTKKK